MTRRSSAAYLAALLVVASCSEDGVEFAHDAPMIHYLEIVTEEVDDTCSLYEQTFGVEFGAPDDALGRARVAVSADGSMTGVRAPLAAHENPIVRTYLQVPDIDAAVAAARRQGGVVAYGPESQGTHGKFAIVIVGGVQHGYWQR